MSCYSNEYSSGSVNGVSCAYAKLGRYNNCSKAEVLKVPDTTGVFVPKGAEVSAMQAAAANAAGQPSIVNSVPVGANGLPVASAPVNVATPSVGATEGFVDEYTPSYRVLNIPPIDTNALTHGGKGTCGKYFDVMSAYGMGPNSDGNSCVTNYINN